MNVDTAQLFWAAVSVLIGNALVVGISWGMLKSDMRHARDEIAEIKEKLGNGEPGVFVRRDERLAERVHRLEERLDHR